MTGPRAYNRCVYCGKPTDGRIDRKRFHTKREKDLLTEQQRQYVEKHENDIIINQLIDILLHLWTDKDAAGQGALVDKVPKGSSFGKVLAEASEDHMFKLAKQMTDDALNRMMYDIRTLRAVGDKFRDILYTERELRKQKDKTFSA